MIAVPAAAQPCEMQVCINGEPMAYVLECVYEQKRDGVQVCPVGAQECAAVDTGADRYEITLRRFTTAGLENRWTAQKDFELSVQTGTRRIRFSGCEWLEVRNQITAGGSAVNAVRLAACSMTEEDL